MSVQMAKGTGAPMTTTLRCDGICVFCDAQMVTCRHNCKNKKHGE
jgi:hypothetical protein